MIKHSTFKPAWWLPNGHWQTVYPALFRRTAPEILRQRQRLQLDDGDFIDLDFYGKSHQPLVLMLHGLAGNSHSGYILGLQSHLNQQGWSSVVMNYRGCSGEVNRLARAYHAGESDDLQHVFSYLQQRYPDRQLAVVGFSLGGNILLKWLGEGRTINGLSAAVAVSVPLQLDACATRLDTGFSRLYREYLLVDLKRYMQDKYTGLISLGLALEAEKIMALGDLRKIHSFWEYDDQVVAKLHGFANVEAYYQQASARQYLHAIQHPCLIVQAADDPFMTAAVIPSADELSPSIEFELSEHGGHVGFIAGHVPGCPEYWLEQRISAFLRCHLPAG
ncbi:MAG: hydrolase [Methylococcaceae bacterium]|nr:hydrolase [Methylococcaceae bacterium]